MDYIATVLLATSFFLLCGFWFARQGKGRCYILFCLGIVDIPMAFVCYSSFSGTAIQLVIAAFLILASKNVYSTFDMIEQIRRVEAKRLDEKFGTRNRLKGST
jgi:hypothetical protein